MTAPIQEPNIYRHASGLQWGQNQLFRRPSPPSGNIIPYIRAITDDTVFSSPLPFPSGSLEDLHWTHWEISDTSIFEANSFIGSDLYIWEGKVTGLYRVKLQAAFVFTGNPESVTFQLYTECVGGSVTGPMNLYFEQLGHSAQADTGSAYMFTSMIDVPPFDPQGTAINPADPPTGFLGYAQCEVITDDASDGDLKWSRMECYYDGPLPDAEFET